MPGRPVRVLYLDHTAQLSGGELALARLLGALDRTRVEPLVVLGEDGPLHALLAQQSVDTCVLALSGKVRDVRKGALGVGGLVRQLSSIADLWRYAKQIGQLAQDRRVDLIYTNTLKADCYGALAAWLAKVPVVWHVRDRIERGYLPLASVWLMRFLARRVPVCIIANSASTLATLKLQRAKPTAVIASGLTREHIERCRNPGRSNPVPQIGIIGRIASWKGQDVFLQAAALLLRKGFSARFQIAGAPMFGEEAVERRLRELASSLGIEQQVDFLGFSDVPTVLRSLDVLVHASKLPEPFGQVIIEGMAAEVPVIATDAGGAREIIANGRTGLLVPCADAGALAAALEQLLSHPERARELAEAGRRHVLQHFTIEQSARHSEALYEQLTGIQTY